MQTHTKRSYDVGYGFRVDTEIYEENGKEYFIVEVTKDGSLQYFDEQRIEKGGE